MSKTTSCQPTYPAYRLFGVRGKHPSPSPNSTGGSQRKTGFHRLSSLPTPQGLSLGSICPPNRRLPETPGVPTLQQMFALAQRMGYEMRPIGRQTDAPRQQSGGRPPVGQDRTFRSQPRTGRDYSKFRCFSCGQFGHMQTRCPKPDASLPYKPAGWFLQSEGNGQRDQRNRTENSP